MSEPPKPSMVPQFIEIVARFADTLVEMDVTTPEARSGRRRNRPTPGAVSRFRHAEGSPYGPTIAHPHDEPEPGGGDLPPRLDGRAGHDARGALGICRACARCW